MNKKALFLLLFLSLPLSLSALHLNLKVEEKQEILEALLPNERLELTARFLRKELGISQRALAGMVGGSEQTVSLWERRGRIPQSADRLLRAMYLEKVNGNVKVTELLNRINELDREDRDRIDLVVDNGHWRRAA